MQGLKQKRPETEHIDGEGKKEMKIEKKQLWIFIFKSIDIDKYCRLFSIDIYFDHIYIPNF